MRRSRNAPLLLLPALLTACLAPELGPEPSVGNPPAERAASVVAANEPQVSGNSGVTPPVTLVFSSIEGAQGERARATFAPVARPLQECRMGTGGGLVRVQIQSGEGRTRYSVLPGSTIDGPRSRCVLETLSTVNVDDMQSRSSPSNRPSGFTGQLVIEF